MVLGVGAAVVMAAWLVGRPILYSTSAPVMSPFTALSLFIMVAVRPARLHLETWPMVLSLAMTGLVLGGNLSTNRAAKTTRLALREEQGDDERSDDATRVRGNRALRPGFDARSRRGGQGRHGKPAWKRWCPYVPQGHTDKRGRPLRAR